MPTKVAFLCQCLFTELTGLSISSGPTSNWKKLVGSTGKGKNAGDYLALKTLVLKGESGDVHHIYFPSDLLTIVGTSFACGFVVGLGAISFLLL